MVDWLMARLDPQEIEYKIATVFSLGVLISTYEYELPSEDYYEKIANCLDGVDLPGDKISDVPSLIFMLPAFMNETTA